jgi:glucose-6-phosphate 1-dehydrogenase
MPAQSSTFIVLGASGDLTSRLLLPALGQLLDREPDRRVRLVGAGQDDWDRADWRDIVTRAFATVGASGPAVDDLLESTEYHKADVTDAKAIGELLAAGTGTVALYFALPPAVTVRVIAVLGTIDLPPGLVLGLEKPFGSDEASARELNQRLISLVPESRIHRVDHFLGRSTVLNVLGVRFANRVLEPVWSAEHIESVTIRYDEVLGLEGRAGYYDRAGALVDMIQSHLLQILAVVAMDPPSTLSAEDLRDGKSIVLRATKVFGDDPTANSRRARYTAGTVGERSLPSYADAPGVDPARETETLAELTVGIADARWAGVPFTLRSGKALGAPRREIVIHFKPVAHLPSGFTGTADPSVLRLTLGPDRMSLELNVNGPGDPFALDRVTLEAEFGPGMLLAYGEVISGILDDDPTLSVRGDTAEQCWRIIQPVLDAWKRGDVPLEEYAAGSEGPSGWPAL